MHVLRRLQRQVQIRLEADKSGLRDIELADPRHHPHRALLDNSAAQARETSPARRRGSSRTGTPRADNASPCNPWRGFHRDPSGLRSSCRFSRNPRAETADCRPDAARTARRGPASAAHTRSMSGWVGDIVGGGIAGHPDRARIPARNAASISRTASSGNPAARSRPPSAAGRGSRSRRSPRLCARAPP